MRSIHSLMVAKTETIVNALTGDSLTRAISYALAHVPGKRLPDNAQSFAGIVEIAETNRTKALEILSLDLKERDIEEGIQL